MKLILAGALLAALQGVTVRIRTMPSIPFEPNGKYRIFVELANKAAVVRPVTPAYPYISSVFAKAAQDILNGADPQKTLDKAVTDIDANIKQNDNYRS